MSLSTLGQVALTVSDVEAAVAFYRDKIGLPFLFSAPPGLAFFNLDGIRLMISAPEDGGTVSGNSTLYFKVDDLPAVYETLRGRGVVFEDTPHLIAKMGAVDLWMAFFRDPDRNLMGLMSEVPASELAK